MHASRWIPALVTVFALGALSSCSSDDGDADSPEASPTANSTVESRNACTADVEVTGAVEKSWSGDASSITENRSGPVQYFATKGKVTLQVLAAEGDFDAIATLTTPRASYTSQGGTVEADDKGAGAKVDADATATKGKPVHITASIDC
ncbi:MAG: hypothetical protein JWO76_971 [Nocardioides sp.]|nr:hypothetical protein [Nocardioides sp.]